MIEHRITTVTLEQGTDVDAFHEEMIGLDVDGSEHVPQRSVEVYDYMPLSLRNIQYQLSKDEADALKNDPRVLDVMWGTTEQNNIIARPIAYYEDGSSRLSRRTTSSVGATSEVNWAINACSNRTDPFVSNELQSFTLKNTATGAGVDLIIQDSGVQESHPEFEGVNDPASRVTRVNWYNYLPTPGNLSTGYYTTLLDGHGTHVASIAAGVTCGWAREARIISQRIQLGNDVVGINILTAFQLLRAWHNAKSVKRPTIVNMSWGYYVDYPTTPNPSLGQVDTYHGVRVASVESEIADCIADGIIFVGAAGNDKHHIAVPGGARYNDNYTYVGQTIYFLRGSTPTATPGVICVGAIDAILGDKKATYSSCGPRVDIYAPGSGIIGAWDHTTANPVGYYVGQYQTSGTYKLARLSGTSQASPQVAGVLAAWLEYNPKATYLEAIEWITSISTKNRITDVSPNSFTNYLNLQGSANRFLYNGNFAYLVLKNVSATGFTVRNVPTYQP
jgi:subtilisin family serine protease